MSHHQEATAFIAAAPDELFARLDDQTRLAEHMAKPSMMMGGGRMTYSFDAGRGQAVGSHILMGGKAFGLDLFVDEEVIERDPPRRKVWRTVGEPRLLVIDGYTMGFEIAPAAGGSNLRVWIDYDRPARMPGRWIPSLAEMYARWCVDRMTVDARTAFGHPAERAA